MLEVLAPLAMDVIVTGEGRDQVGVLIIPVPGLLAEGRLMADDGACLGAEVVADVRRRLATRAEGARGSAGKVVRALFLSEPPSMAEGEITAKGNLNFRKVLERRAGVLDRLYGDDAAVARI